MVWKRYGWMIAIGLLVVATATGLALTPGAWPAAMPFLAVLLGIVLRTLVPFISKALESMQQTGEWPSFERQYLLPPLAAMALDVVWFAVALLTQPGYVGEVRGLGFVIAVAAGYGGQGFIRDVQKLVRAQWQRSQG